MILHQEVQKHIFRHRPEMEENRGYLQSWLSLPHRDRIPKSAGGDLPTLLIMGFRGSSKYEERSIAFTAQSQLC